MDIQASFEYIKNFKHLRQETAKPATATEKLNATNFPLAVTAQLAVVTENTAQLTLIEQMMKACKNNVHVIHAFKRPMGTFVRVQDFKRQNASTRQTTTTASKQALEVNVLRRVST